MKQINTIVAHKQYQLKYYAPSQHKKKTPPSYYFPSLFGQCDTNTNSVSSNSFLGAGAGTSASWEVVGCSSATCS